MKHFWLVGFAVMLVNIGIGRVRMRSMIARGTLTAAEADRFCIGAAIVLAVVSLSFELLALVTGLPPECQLRLPVTHRALWTSHGLTLAFGVALMLWLWALRGDETLAKVGPAFNRGWGQRTSYEPKTVRLWLTAILVVAWGGHFGGRLMMPEKVPIDGVCAAALATESKP